MTWLPSARTSADACPGALRPHHAADGDLVRLRLPGGALDPSALLALAALAGEFADGRLGLTSRGNLQLRGVAAGTTDRLAGRVRAAGLLPSLSHELVRNIVASPLSGRIHTSLTSIDALVDDLDKAVCAAPELAGLPGRFLFAVDDGSGDVASAGADVLLQAHGAAEFAVLLGGTQQGLLVSELDVVSTAMAVAEAFLAERAAQGGTAWRLAELEDGPERVLARAVAPGRTPLPAGDASAAMASQAAAADADAAGGWTLGAAPAKAALPEQELPPGLIEQTDGRFAVCVLTPLGLITREQAGAIAAAAQLSDAPEHGPDGAIRVTPWRRVVLRDLQLAPVLAARELLDAAGLVVTDSAWGRVTACAGRPGCAKSLSDVHADARDFVAQAPAPGGSVHWVGCARGCGTPSGPVALAIATGDGYSLEGGAGLVPAEQAWIGAR